MHDSGYLSVTINNSTKFTEEYFHKDSTVIENCVSTLDSISISNPNTDAWVGEIIVTKNEIRQKLNCTNCGNGNMGQMVDGKLSVDGDGNAIRGSAWCLNGKVCNLKLLGKD